MCEKTPHKLDTCLSIATKAIFYNLLINYSFLGGASDKKSACQPGDPVLFLDWENPLEKKMTTHSRIPALEIPGTEEPGGLQSMRSQRVRHNQAGKQQKQLLKDIAT